MLFAFPGVSSQSSSTPGYSLATLTGWRDTGHRQFLAVVSVILTFVRFGEFRQPGG
jgi:hypothetical protein